jgi:serine/threonine protein kinase
MASNYSSEPEGAASLNNPLTPNSGPGGSLPDPNSDGANSNGHRRLSTGTMLSAQRYKIDKLAAAGGMGAVYRAIDTRFNRPCAVKEMLDEFQNDSDRKQAVEWFEREATLLLDLNHPCIPRVRDFFVEMGKHYLVMDYIEGRTLNDVLENNSDVIGNNGARGVTEALARSWGQQLCSVLAYLHRQTPPIIFRDLKPSNIMVTDRDEIKLIDFGIARTFQTKIQSTVIMTIGYAPPEQLHGMAEPRSDLYALGATLFRVLTRHDAANNKPSIFSFPSLRSLRPDISPAFEQVVMKALSPVLEQRWGSAAEMERAILNLQPVSANPSATPQFASPGISRLNNPATPNSGSPLTPNAQTQHTMNGPAGGHITAALTFVNANRLDEAHAAIMMAHTLEPNNSIVHRIFGQIFARRKPPMIEQAMKAYLRSLQLNPDDAETHKLIGDVWYYLRKQPLTAIKAYTESLRLNPNDFESHLRLAQCYEETNQLEPALREFQEAVRLAPKSVQVGLHQRVGQLALRVNNLSVAERAFVALLTINPGDSATRFQLSQVYEMEGKLADAERECSYVVGMIPAAQPVLQRIKMRLGR